MSIPLYHPIQPLLYFGTENAKLAGTGTATFSLPAGLTCPGAKDCLAHVDRTTGKIVDGPNTLFRCFAATMELRPGVRRSVDRNLAILRHARTRAGMASVIYDSLPARAWRRIRVHVDGDYFNATYFKAWMDVARRDPDRFFYGYTKSLPYWLTNIADVPDNLLLTASWGGKYDRLIEPNNLRSAVTVYHPEMAEAWGLDIDHDDSLASNPAVHKFALLIHNTQPKGTPAAAAIARLKKEGVPFSYSSKPKKPTHVF